MAGIPVLSHLPAILSEKIMAEETREIANEAPTLKPWSKPRIKPLKILATDTGTNISDEGNDEDAPTSPGAMNFYAPSG